jgi:hypothetical protein
MSVFAGTAMACSSTQIVRSDYEEPPAFVMTNSA